MYTIDEITGAWYEAYGEYLKDEYPGFLEILEKKMNLKQAKEIKGLNER